MVGCVLTLAALALGAGLALQEDLARGVLPVTFTAAWSVVPALTDETGLWVVGAVQVLVGTLLGTTVVSSAGAAVRRRLARDR